MVVVVVEREVETGNCGWQSCAVYFGVRAAWLPNFDACRWKGSTMYIKHYYTAFRERSNSTILSCPLVEAADSAVRPYIFCESISTSIRESRSSTMASCP